MAVRAATLILALLLPIQCASAHDFWIEPGSYRPGAGVALPVNLMVGELFIGDALPRNSASIELFALYLGLTAPPRAVIGTDGIAPAGFVLVDDARTTLLAFSGAGGVTELPPDRFTAYLRSHGLEWVEVERKAREEEAKAARERFHRHAKVLFTATSADAVAGRVLGQILEIVPDGDPTQDASPSFSGKILWRGEPLAGCLILARSYSDPLNALQSRSDAAGRFSLPLARGGVWLLQTVWMERAGWFSGQDWESHWSSLTFLKPEPR